MQVHLFLIQFFIIFHMEVSVLLSMAAFSTTFLLVKILQQPIRIIKVSSYWSCHGEENACYHVKKHKELGEKSVSKKTLHFVWGTFIEKIKSAVSTLKILWPRLGSLLIHPFRLNLCATFYFCHKDSHNPSRVGRPVIASLACRGLPWIHVIFNLDFHETYCPWPRIS